MTTADCTAQWLRKASLIVGGDDALDLSGLRFTFDVQRGDQQTPNSVRIKVYNPSDDTVWRAMNEFTRLVLQAGYEGNYGIIFDGSIVQARRGRENGTDSYLDLVAADGDSAYNFAFVNTTLAAGAGMTEQVDAALAQMAPHGVTRGYLAALPAERLPRGKVMFGLARDFLRGVAKNANCVWSIQDGQAVMVPETSYLPGDIPVISARSGMIGSPSRDEKGIKVTMLLNPSIRIASLIRIDHRYLAQQPEASLSTKQDDDAAKRLLRSRLQHDGYYYVMSATHRGDTGGGDWYTEALCLAADSSALPEALEGFQRSATPPAVIPT